MGIKSAVLGNIWLKMMGLLYYLEILFFSSGNNYFRYAIMPFKIIYGIYIRRNDNNNMHMGNYHRMFGNQSPVSLCTVHDIKFVTENAKKKKKSSEVIPSQIVECNLPKNIYRCNFCDKEFPRQDSLAHRNTKHLSTSISLLTYTDTLTMSNVKVSNLFSSVGQCTTCLHYLGSSSNTQLVSTVKEHNASDHTKVITELTTKPY